MKTPEEWIKEAFQPDDNIRIEWQALPQWVQSIQADARATLIDALKKAKVALEELSKLGGGRSEGNLIARRALEKINELSPE